SPITMRIGSPPSARMIRRPAAGWYEAVQRLELDPLATVERLIGSDNGYSLALSVGQGEAGRGPGHARSGSHVSQLAREAPTGHHCSPASPSVTSQAGLAAQSGVRQMTRAIGPNQRRILDILLEHGQPMTPSALTLRARGMGRPATESVTGAGRARA